MGVRFNARRRPVVPRVNRTGLHPSDTEWCQPPPQPRGRYHHCLGVFNDDGPHLFIGVGNG
eukprot:6387184-Lingulodinium_polyedra.AAC.1